MQSATVAATVAETVVATAGSRWPLCPRDDIMNNNYNLLIDISAVAGVATDSKFCTRLSVFSTYRVASQLFFLRGPIRGVIGVHGSPICMGSEHMGAVHFGHVTLRHRDTSAPQN